MKRVSVLGVGEMKLDVRSLCSRLPTYFSMVYSEHVFSEEMRLIRPLLEVEGEEEVNNGDVASVIREEFYSFIEQLLEGRDAGNLRDVLKKYADWAISQLDRVGVEK